MATDKTEAYELSRLGATPTKNSGRGAFQKGDGIIFEDEEPLLTVDVKEYAASYAVSQKSWAKISTDAKKNGNSEPMLHLALGTEEPRTRVVCISEGMFLMLLEAYQNQNKD